MGRISDELRIFLPPATRKDIGTGKKGRMRDYLRLEVILVCGNSYTIFRGAEEGSQSGKGHFLTVSVA